MKCTLAGLTFRKLWGHRASISLGVLGEGTVTQPLSMLGKTSDFSYLPP